MKSLVQEFPANGKCLALCSCLFPDAWERPTSCDWRDSTRPMLPAFTIKLAAVCAQVLFELGALQASTNSSRRVGSCSCSASSRLASKTISSASFKFSRASSKVLPWVLTPGISSTQAAHQSSTCLYAAVSFMLISSLDSGSLSSRSQRTKSFRSPWMNLLSTICR